MNYYRLYAAIIVIALYGCSTPDTNVDIEEISIGINSDIDPNTFLQVTHLTLDNLPNRILGSVDEITYDANNIYVLEQTPGNQKIVVYSKTGKLKGVVGNEGRGPGEYITPYSLSVDANNIIIYDVSLEKQIFYDKNNFSFVKAVDIPFATSGFKYLSDSLMVWNNDNYMDDKYSNYYFITTDTLFNIKKGYIEKIIKTGYKTGPPLTMYSLEGVVKAYTPFLPYIYKVTEGGCETEYKINFNNCTLPPTSFMKKISQGGKNYYSDLENSEYVSYFKVFETSNAMCISHIVNKNGYVTFHNKIQKNTYTYKRSDFENIMNLESSYLAGVVDNQFVIPIESDSDNGNVVLCLIKITNNDI